MLVTPCPHCAKPTSAKSAKCAHCARPIGHAAPRVPHHSIACPRCNSATDTAALGSVELDICRSCRGLWFDRAELRTFGEATSEATLNGQVAELLRELGQRASRAPEQTYIPCPVCGMRMSRTNYASMSGIILHSCIHHGTWADHDAAVRFVELMATGNEARLLELAAQHKERELQRQLGHLHARQQAQTLRLAKLDARAQIHFVLDMFDVV